MPYRPSQRKHTTRTVTLKLDDGGRFNVSYRPGAIDADTIRATRNASPDDDDLALYVMAARIISDWELEDDQGQTIPVAVDAMDTHLDVPLVNWILERVFEDAKPGEARLGSLRRG